MKKNIKGCFVLIAAFTFSTMCYAQKRLPCGPYKIDTAALNSARQFRELNGNRDLAVNSLVRIFFHLVTNNDGTNGALTTAQIPSEFTALLASYAADNVCFINAGFDYVKNTSLNTGFNADNDPSGTAFNPYQVPNCVNVFYMQVINGNNTACNPPCGYGGIALGGIPGTFFLVGSSNIGDGSTIGHEMGHCLGLLHTFEKVYGYENIDGSNSSTAGDRIQDTPADPFAYNGQSCYKTANCFYTGTCPDPNGAKNFTPPYNNLMSYWQTNVCFPVQALSNGQFTVVNSILAQNAALINCSSPADITQFAITLSSGYLMKSAINTFTTNGNVIFNGTAKVGIGGGKVDLKPGFHATPSTNGRVKITGRPCN